MSEGGAPSLAERLATLEAELRGVRADLGELLALVQGPPWERSLRGRMHTLEAESSAAKAAAHALAEAQRERRIAREERQSSSASRWDWRWKALGALCAVAAAAAPYIILAVHR